MDEKTWYDLQVEQGVNNYTVTVRELEDIIRGSALPWSYFS